MIWILASAAGMGLGLALALASDIMNRFEPAGYTLLILVYAGVTGLALAWLRRRPSDDNAGKPAESALSAK